MSLAEIILNNKMMKHQTDDIKDDSREEMYIAIIQQVPRYFDRTRGSTAYSFAFRIGYTTCVHVLEKYNKERNLQQTINDLVEEYNNLANSARKITNINPDD